MFHTYPHFNPNKYRLDVKIAVVNRLDYLGRKQRERPESHRPMGSENERHPNVWDQKNLQGVLNRMPDGNPEVPQLPEAYFKTFDTMASVEGAVIEQYQKSRTHRRKVNAANLNRKVQRKCRRINWPRSSPDSAPSWSRSITPSAGSISVSRHSSRRPIRTSRSSWLMTARPTRRWRLSKVLRLRFPLPGHQT